MLCCPAGGFTRVTRFDMNVVHYMLVKWNLTDSCHSLDELAHVLAQRFAARPLAFAVSIERVRGHVFLMSRAERDKIRFG